MGSNIVKYKCRGVSKSISYCTREEAEFAFMLLDSVPGYSAKLISSKLPSVSSIDTTNRLPTSSKIDIRASKPRLLKRI